MHPHVIKTPTKEEYEAVKKYYADKGLLIQTSIWSEYKYDGGSHLYVLKREDGTFMLNLSCQPNIAEWKRLPLLTFKEWSLLTGVTLALSAPTLPEPVTVTTYNIHYPDGGKLVGFSPGTTEEYALTTLADYQSRRAPDYKLYLEKVVTSRQRIA